MNLFSNKYIVEYNDDRNEFIIDCYKKNDDCMPLVVVKIEALREMDFKQASEFLGERLILLIPALRELYSDYLWGDNGEPPKK